MNTLRIALCCDEESVIDHLRFLVESVKLPNYRVRLECYRTGTDILKSYRGSYQPFELIIIDSSLPAMSGYRIANRLRTIEKEANIAILAKSNEPIKRAVGANLQAYKFLFKPISSEAFGVLIDDMFSRLDSSMQRKLVVRTRQQVYCINPCDILYIDRIDRKTRINLNNGEIISSAQGFSSLLAAVDSENFVIINKCVAMNISQIFRFDLRQKLVEMKNGKRLPVTRNRIQLLAEQYGRYYPNESVSKGIATARRKSKREKE